MKDYLSQIYAVALALSTAGLAQGAITLTGGPGSDSYAVSKGITITGGPGSDDSPAVGVGLSPTGPGTADASYRQTNGMMSQERIVQTAHEAVAEDLVGLGLVPPPGAPLYGGVGVNPNPSSRRQNPANPGSVDVTGILTPSGNSITGSGSLGMTDRGGSIGLPSGGSSAVGLVAPSGTFSPPASIAGTPGTGTAGSLSSVSGR